MKKRTPQLRFRAWTLWLVVLGSALVGAQDAGRVFIQGSEVNLRASPNPKAEVVTKVPIATECQLLANAPKEWVRLKCGEAEGFTLKSLVGPDKPNVDTLLAQALDTRASTPVRYDAASWAAALDPNNAQALDLLAYAGMPARSPASFRLLSNSPLEKIDCVASRLTDVVWEVD